MKKYAATLAAALVALMGLVALAPSAQAYPTAALYLNLNLDRVVSGHVFVAIAKATVNCDTLTVTWNGQTASAHGSKVTHQFRAPIVTSTVVITAHATCIYTSTSGNVGNAISAKPSTLTATADVTVVPVAGNAGKLPNTGGPSIAWLIAGIGALLAGAGTMFAGRRRTSTMTAN